MTTESQVLGLTSHPKDLHDLHIKKSTNRENKNVIMSVQTTYYFLSCIDELHRNQLV